MKKNIIERIDKILSSKTSTLSSEDIEELIKIKEQAGQANTIEKLLELAVPLAKFFGYVNDIFDNT